MIHEHICQCTLGLLTNKASYIYLNKKGVQLNTYYISHTSKIFSVAKRECRY